MLPFCAYQHTEHGNVPELCINICSTHFCNLNVYYHLHGMNFDTKELLIYFTLWHIICYSDQEDRGPLFFFFFNCNNSLVFRYANIDILGAQAKTHPALKG